jgi:G3E family GTPase
MKTLASENSLSRLPIHLITGFLGSGKTTLLNQLLRQPAMQKTMIIVNEFGEVGIDHLLIKASIEDIIMLEGGCLCCSVRTDLVNTLETLYSKRERQEIPTFEQILIETTGLADPAPILRTLIKDTFIANHYRLEVVVTTVDAVYGAQQLADHDESAKQAALAHHLVLTKIDLVNQETLEYLKQRLRVCNPTATLHEINLQQQQVDAATLFTQNHYDWQTKQLNVTQWLQAEVYLNIQPNRQISTFSPRHDAYIKTFCIEYHQPLPWLTLERWIQQLTQLRGKDLLRVKGIAYTVETELPVIIQGVQHIFQPPVTLEAWPTSARRSQIVFITRNLEHSVVAKLLDALIQSKTPQEVCAAALILLDVTN